LKIFISGASGLLGSHLIHQAISNGIEVCANYRTLTKRNYLFHHKDHPLVSLYPFDLTQEDDFPEIKGVDAVINCAALASSQSSDEVQMRLVNIQAAKNLFNWTAKNNIKKFVQISSSAAIKDTQNSIRSTAYAQTKFEIDQWLKDQDSTEVTTIYPGYMLGAWDARPSSGSVFFALRLKKFSSYIDNTKNFVAASDVASCVIETIKQNQSGDFKVGGVNIKISEFLNVFSEITSQAITYITSFPENTPIEELNLNEKEYPLISEFCDTRALDDERTRSTIGYRHKKDVEYMIRETLEYFEKERMLRFKK